jgi:hypothetical protein
MRLEQFPNYSHQRVDIIEVVAIKFQETVSTPG